MKYLIVFFVFCFLILSVTYELVDIDSLHSEKITVTIDGEVKKPGTYELDPYSTLSDLLNVSGVEEDADLEGFSTDMILFDRAIIDVPARSESQTERVSINHADIEQLVRLPGIGESTAEKIVEYRMENGGFLQLEDLMNVKGIGEAKFSALSEWITL